MQNYRIFLSHKFGELERQRAETIEQVLSGLSSHVEIYNPGTDITTATTWREEITKELKQSDMLLLLYADPRQDWAWCTYEAGLFSRIDSAPEDLDPIVVIHYETSNPPTQLDHLQCLQAEQGRVREFLHDLFRTTEITHARWPLDSRITDAEIDDAATEICAQFRKPDQFYATYRLELALPAGLEDHTIMPREARVLSTTAGTLSLFGLADDSEHTWGDLVANQEGSDWLDEFNEAFALCVAKRIPDPAMKTFRPPRDSMIVRPTIFRIDSYDGCPHVVCVIFTQEPAPGRIGGRVFNMLRSLERTKKELISRFVDFTEPADPALSLDYELEAVKVASELIDAESHELGVFDPEVLRECFPDTVVLEHLKRIGQEWHNDRKQLLKGVEANDRGAVLHQLIALSGHVDQFARIASERYAVMVSERPGALTNGESDKIDAEEEVAETV